MELLKTKKGSLKIVNGDVTDYDSLVQSIPQGVEVVFHVAAKMSVYAPDNNNMYKVNVLGTRNVVNSCIQKGVSKLVHTSTIGVYCGSKDCFNVTEDYPKNAVHHFSGYTYSKYFAELEVKKGIEKGLWATFTNPGAIIGKYDSSGFIRVAYNIKNGELPGVGSSVVPHGNVVEIAIGHIRAAEKAKLGENYIMVGPSFTFKGLVDEFGKNINVDTSKIFHLPYAVGKIVGELYGYASKLLGKELPITPENIEIVFQKSSASSAKAVRELGYNDKITVSASVKQAVDYLKQNNKI